MCTPYNFHPVNSTAANAVEDVGHREVAGSVLWLYTKWDSEYNASGNKIFISFELNNVFFQKKLFGSKHYLGSNNAYASPAGSERKNCFNRERLFEPKNVLSPKLSQNCKKMSR